VSARRRREWREHPDAPRARYRLRRDATVVEGPVTPRQRDILALTSEGLTTVEIGEVLGITPKTVRTHRDATLRRLPARNITHAVAILLRRGDIL
jgi:DNA-binding CsgD family transcriptional regulator